MFGAGGGTSSYREAEETDLFLLWGSNARETHPIFFHHLLKGVRRGARLIAIDPRRTSSAEWADLWLGLDVGSDIALANAMAREIIHAGLANDEFIGRATSGFEAYREAVEPYTLEYAQRETGVPAEAIREAAHAYAKADRAMICWTLGITEHHNAVDNVLALISLALLTGHVGRYGSGINPLRGQNNVQGGGDMGALPDRLVGFQHVENDEPRERCDDLWGVRVPPKRGLHLSGMFEAMERGELTALYVIGENPLQSEADRHHTEKLLRGLDLLVVQDIFLTATGEIADIVLPAAAAWAESEGTVTNSERRVQRVHRALVPPGEAKDDLWIIFEIAKRMGADWGEADAEAVWNEVRELSPVHRGMTYARLEASGGLQWPCYDESHPGELFLHSRLWEDPVPGNLRAVRAGRARPARRPPRRRLPDPPHDRAPPGLVQHGRPVGRVSVSQASRRDARPGARGSRALRAGRGGTGAGGVATGLRRGAGAGRRGAAARPRVHDAPLPGRRHDQQPDDRRDGPQVRHGRVQGDGDPDREAGRSRRRLRRPRRRASARPRSIRVPATSGVPGSQAAVQPVIASSASRGSAG